MTTPTRTVVPYFGGKWKIASWIAGHFPEHRVYTESFGGSAAVLMKKEPSPVEIYNDTSQEMVNLFRVLRDRKKASRLKDLLQLTPYSRQEWIDCHRMTRNQLEQARRTIVVMTMSTNSGKAITRDKNGWKSHSREHNPAASFRSYIDQLELIITRLQGVIIENRDAFMVIGQHDQHHALHYVDPPYLGDTRRGMRTRYLHEFHTAEDHQRLAEFLRSLQGYVFLSAYPSPEYDQLYGKNGWMAISTKSTDAGTIKGKGSRTEVLWMNPRAAAHQNFLFTKI